MSFTVEESGDHDAPYNRGNAARMVPLGAGRSWSRCRESGRETPLRRPAVQLQQTRASRGEHLGRAARMHQA